MRKSDHSNENYDSEEKCFIAIINTAFYNFQLALEEVNNYFYLPQTNNFPQLINELFGENISYSNWDQRMDHLSEFLPWLSSLQNLIHKNKYIPNYQKRKFFTQTLICFYNILKSSTNKEPLNQYYINISIDDKIKEVTIRKILDDLLLKSIIVIRKQIKKSDFLNYIIQNYNTEFNENIFWINKNGKQKEIYGDQKINYIINRCFDLFTDPKRNPKDKIKNNFDKLKFSTLDSIDNLNYKFSYNGLIFFISLFLQKQDVEKIIEETFKFKSNNKIKHWAIYKVFSFFSFKDIRKSIRNDYSEHILLMQMIKELYSCPEILYNPLSKENKKLFIEDFNNNSNVDSLIEKQIINPKIKKRIEERFSYFTLRFIDEYYNFPSLRFQIASGEYISDKRIKIMKSTGLKTNRIIKKQVNYIGKLSDIEKVKKDFFNKSNIHTNSWVKYSNSYYIIENNKILIYIHFDDDEKIPKTDFFYKDIGQNKENTIRKKRLDELSDTLPNTDKTPNAFLSANELPALLYELIFKNKTEKDIEELIRSKIKEQIDEIINEPEKRFKNKLPKKLKQILFSKESYEDGLNINKLHQDIFNLTKEGNDKLSELKDDLEQLKNKTLSLKKSKEYAKWLAYDIKRFSGKEQYKKWKSYQFKELQSLLSLYDTKNHLLIKFLNHDIQVKEHPFIFDAIKTNKFDTFIKKYIELRNEFLENLTKQDIKEILKYFKERYYKIYSDKKEYFNILFQHPINLDRGVFSKEATAYNKKEKENIKLAEWFEFAENQPKQKFYDLPREYIIACPEKEKHLIFKLQPNLSFIEQIPSIIKDKYKSDTGKIDKEHPEINNFIKKVYKNEREIRKIKRNDVFILEMIKKLFYRITDQNLDRISLDNMFLSLDKSETTLSDILNYPIDISLYNGVIKDKIKIKDINKFILLEKNPKVKTLVDYYEFNLWKNKEHSLTWKDITVELDSYYKIRLKEIFSYIYKFKKEIRANVIKNQDEEFLFTQYYESQKNIDFENLLSYYFQNNEDNIQSMIFNIKNCFQHDILPSKELYITLLEKIPNTKNTLSEYYLHALKFLIKELKYKQLVQ